MNKTQELREIIRIMDNVKEDAYIDDLTLAQGAKKIELNFLRIADSIKKLVACL